MKLVIAWILLGPALLISAAVLFFGLLHIIERFEPPDRVIVSILGMGIVGYLMLLSAWRKEDKEEAKDPAPRMGRGPTTKTQ